MSQRHAVIIGGGLAGMAAAEAMSRLDPSLHLTLLESKRHFGGRAGSYRDTDSESDVDYCQHVAMGCCTNFIDLMNRCGLDESFRRYDALTFLHPDFPPSRFAPHPWLPAPFHLGRTIDALRYLTKFQKREIKHGLWKLMRSVPESLVDVPAARWLEAAGQSNDTRRDFWDVILVSALGEQTEHVSMAAARKVLIDGFAATRGASDVLVPAEPLSLLFAQRLQQSLTRRGVEIRSEARVKQVHSDSTVLTESETFKPDVVICAVPWHQIEKLFDGWSATERESLPDLKAISAIPSSPITGIHLWFDRPLTDLDHAVMVGTVAQWLFRNPCDSKPRPNHPSGSHPSASKLDQNEHYHQVVISASVDPTSGGKKTLLSRILSELRHAFPEARDAVLLRHRIVTDPQSVFSVSPSTESSRPNTSTGLPWLKLAGDWTQTGWPATMEGAVISGRIAARESLLQLGGRGRLSEDPVKSPLKPGRLAKWLIRGADPKS